MCKQLLMVLRFSHWLNLPRCPVSWRLPVVVARAVVRAPWGLGHWVASAWGMGHLHGDEPTSRWGGWIRPAEGNCGQAGL